jgi:hypothetical protein
MFSLTYGVWSKYINVMWFQLVLLNGPPGLGKTTLAHTIARHAGYNVVEINANVNQRLPGACNRSPGSKLLSITTQLHCGGHLGGRAWLPDTILEKDHPMTIPSKFGSNWATGSRKDGLYQCYVISVGFVEWTTRVG